MVTLLTNGDNIDSTFAGLRNVSDFGGIGYYCMQSASQFR